MSWVAVAVVGAAVIGGAVTAYTSKEAAETAAEAQTEAAQTAITYQESEFDKLQETLRPYVEAGETALTAQQALIGLGGAEAQQAAITQLEESPEFTETVRMGEEAILQQSAATGGLRGGNVQAALAQYRPQILSQMIESQYAKLGGLTNVGQASAAQQAAAGMGAATSVGGYLTQQGAAEAGAAIAQGQAVSQAVGDVAGAVGTGATLYALQGGF